MHGECVEPVVTAPTPAHMYCIKHLKQSRMLVRMPSTSVPSKLPSLWGLIVCCILHCTTTICAVKTPKRDLCIPWTHTYVALQRYDGRTCICFTG